MREHRDIEQRPTRVSRRVIRGYNDNWHNRLPWNKMRSWIKGQVGKHFDDAFSEFVHLDWLPDHERTRERFGDQVELHAWEEDGHLYYYDYFGRVQDVCDITHRSKLYVHPRTGIICATKRVRCRSYKDAVQDRVNTHCRILGDYHQLHRSDKGIWYEIKLATHRVAECRERQEDGTFKTVRYDAPNPTRSPYNSTTNPYGTGWGHWNLSEQKITFKRQLSKEELRKYGLKNKPMLWMSTLNKSLENIHA